MTSRTVVKPAARTGSRRLGLFVGAIFILVGLVGYRLFNLSFLQHENFLKTAQSQYQKQNQTTIAGRGSIYLSDLATGGRHLAAANGQSNTRLYPLNTSAAQVLGFVGFSGAKRAGQYGVEAYYNETLTAGGDLVLTLDKNIQDFAETKLEQVLKKWSAPAGTIVIQDPKTGAILAMASSPSYDPNNYGSYKLQNFINPASQEVYEPGSSFKPITLAAALDSGAVTPETKYIDSGTVEIASYTIKNFDEQSHGVQTMRQVLERSLNTGAIFAEQKTGDDNFLNYVVNFGFGQKTGVDLAGETSGNITNLYTGRKINFLTASFGQGIAVTPIQLISAYSVIANNGKLLRPYLVREIVNQDGSKQVAKPKILGSPISEKTARDLQSMLIDVVDKGFDKARIKGYAVAGKTGTAQIPNSTATSAGEIGYLSNQFIHNFVGFAPADNPRFTVLIKMDRPQGIKFAADSLSPVFGEIARYLIRYFNIPPTRQ
ncbi:MAG: penicillin-binding protein 2 [Patescibacteria group bacterium]